jgi:redox-sensitive bicupin YhaK (pirin superfamily)
MTAGSGLIHSELPEQEQGLMEGFQLWLNLPARNKMIAPGYRDIAPAAIPEFTAEGGVRVRVIAGESHGVAGAVTRPDTEPLFLDVHLPARARFTQTLPAGHNAFTCTYRGSARIAGTEVPDRHMAILANDGTHAVCIEAIADARVLIVAGRPLNEPIAQHGPFVMNTAEELRRAFDDYRRGAFEAAAVRSM